MVISADHADAMGLPYDFAAAMITLRAFSALETVGLTAVVSTALANAGISCNIVAGYYHDHLFVPTERARQAVAILERLGSTPE